MISSQTVFVLGAGASAPFGFPLGQQLCDRVIKGLAVGGQQRVDLLNTTGFVERNLDHFREELRLSAQPSVDAFLEHRTEFIDIGKAAMAAILIGCEKPDEVWKDTGSWLRIIFNHMRCAFEEFENNQVAFVTFNYDRSLEYFFAKAMAASYGKKIEECAQILSTFVPIIHLHGRLGYLPWEKEGGRDFNDTRDVRTVEMCVNNIKIVHEDIADGRDKDFELASKLINEAERITFLGVGYGETNIKRLRIEGLGKNKIVGTAVGLTERECADIRSRWGERIVPHAGANCEQVLRNYVDWSPSIKQAIQKLSQLKEVRE